MTLAVYAISVFLNLVYVSYWVEMASKKDSEQYTGPLLIMSFTGPFATAIIAGELIGKHIKKNKKKKSTKAKKGKKNARK